VLRVLRPLGVEAAVKAIEVQSSETTAAERQLELSLQQAGMRPLMPVDSTMLSIRPTGSSPASWNAGGTRLCKPLPGSRATSRP
jgi:hypothetical protein